jgi:hypothetical protein
MALVDGSLVAERMLAVADAARKRRAATNLDVLGQREVDFANSTVNFQASRRRRRLNCFGNVSLGGQLPGAINFLTAPVT